MHPILVNGNWVPSNASDSFTATNPTTGQVIPEPYPISNWKDCDQLLGAATNAFEQMRLLPNSQLAKFIDTYADRIEARTEEICEIANLETGLPVQPRLADIELPRTTNQLRQAAQAVRTASWARPTIDTATGIRSVFSAIGPVAIFGPNNFPLAFGSISGGDFAAAIAAGNPIIAKANSSHPGTTRLLAEEALQAARACNMPNGTVQMLYRTSHAHGEKLVADPRLASVGYTGSRSAGLKLKQVADQHGKPIYLELSSINPVLILPGAICERGAEIAHELANSCLLGTGQFCTSPGLILLIQTPETDSFVNGYASSVRESNGGVLLSHSVQKSLEVAVRKLTEAGAICLCGGTVVHGDAIRFANTVLKTTGDVFLQKPNDFQTEAFGNASLVVVAKDADQICEIIRSLEGNLTGCIYSDSQDGDEEHYDKIASTLRQKVGRLLNDKMPTGVAVSPAMNHGGPFPATGHPGFTAVGLPNAIIRFAMLQCYDNVRNHRLPEILRDENPLNVVRNVDGEWSANGLTG